MMKTFAPLKKVLKSKRLVPRRTGILEKTVNGFNSRWHSFWSITIPFRNTSESWRWKEREKRGEENIEIKKWEQEERKIKLYVRCMNEDDHMQTRHSLFYSSFLLYFCVSSSILSELPARYTSMLLNRNESICMNDI